jgi:hypothetical protein
MLKLPVTPFFKHDGAEVEIAAAGNFRMADNLPGTLRGKEDTQ